ncbi:hypothetical protein ACLOJK_028189 [Asimina triloba]
MDVAAQIWIGMLLDGSLAHRLGWSKSSWAIWLLEGTLPDRELLLEGGSASGRREDECSPAAHR